VPQYQKLLADHPGFLDLEPILGPDATDVVPGPADLLVAVDHGAGSLGALRKRGTPFRLGVPRIEETGEIAAVPRVDRVYRGLHIVRPGHPGRIMPVPHPAAAAAGVRARPGVSSASSVPAASTTTAIGSAAMSPSVNACGDS
jgi:hypothetical protein